MEPQDVHPHPQNLNRFLLGQMEPGEREAMEAAFLRDDALYERLLTAEDDLIDAYVRRELGEDDRRSFQERYLASPRRRERVAFARALVSLADEAPSSSRADRRWGARAAGLLRAAAVAAMLLGGGWLGLQNWHLSGQAREMATRLENLRPAAVELIFQPLQRSADAGEPRALRRAAGNGLVRLELVLETLEDRRQEYDRFRVRVRSLATGGGAAAGYTVILEGLELASEAGWPTLRLPELALPAGDYEVSVEGYPAGGDGPPEPIGAPRRLAMER